MRRWELCVTEWDDSYSFVCTRVQITFNISIVSTQFPFTVIFFMISPFARSGWSYEILYVLRSIQFSWHFTVLYVYWVLSRRATSAEIYLHLYHSSSFHSNTTMCLCLFSAILFFCIFKVLISLISIFRIAYSHIVWNLSEISNKLLIMIS